MARFAAAKMNGAIDVRFQRAYNDLIDLLDTAWQRVWTQDNDGSGSGLDADTLDTYHASEFLRLAGGGTVTAPVILSGSASPFSIKAGATDDHVYMQLFAESANQNTRSGYFGYSSSGNRTFVLANEITNANVQVRTVGTGKFLVNNASEFTGVMKVLSVIRAKGTGEHNAVMQASNVAGESLFGVSETDDGVLTSYLRVGANKLQFISTSYTNADVWHSGNDGAGSGLDADLFEGEHLASILSQTNPITPTAAITVGRTSWLSIYSNSTGSTGFPNEFGVTYLFTGSSYGRDFAIFKTSGSGTALYVSGINATRDGFSGWQKLWNEGNDGSGSGLDADLLDGNEAAAFLKLTGGTMSGDLTLTGGANIVLGVTTGSQIGTGATQKLGFYGATPVVQRTAYTQTYSTASKTVPAPTAATLTDGSGGTANTTLESVGTAYSQSVIRNNFADLAAMVNKNTADTLAIFKVVTALIDDLQALGFVA